MRMRRLIVKILMEPVSTMIPHEVFYQFFYRFLFLSLWISSGTGRIKSNRTDQVTLSFVGDINYGGPVMFYRRAGLFDYSEPLKHVQDFLRESDLSVGNYECVMTSQNTTLKRHPLVKFRISSETECAGAIRDAGFDVMTVANNHIQDYGEEAANLTIRTLENAGIDVFGYNTGQWDTPQKPLFKEVKGLKIAFLAYCLMVSKVRSVECKEQREIVSLGTTVFTKRLFKRDLQNVKKSKPDFIIVLMHWGMEGQGVPSAMQRNLARYMSRQGVHAVIGAHPHRLLPHEYINKTLVAYSLGNFLFAMNYLNTPFYDLTTSVDGAIQIHPSRKDEMDFLRNATTMHTPNKDSRILQLRLNRKGIVSASYLPLVIDIDTETKCLQPTPTQRDWIDVCSEDDDWCMR